MELSCLVPYTGFLDILMSSLVIMELSCPVPYTGFLDISMSSASSFPEPRLHVDLIDSCDLATLLTYLVPSFSELCNRRWPLILLLSLWL